MHIKTIVARNLGRPGRGTGSRVVGRHSREQGSTRGTHLRYPNSGRGSGSKQFWVDDPGTIRLAVVGYAGKDFAPFLAKCFGFLISSIYLHGANIQPENIA